MKKYSAFSLVEMLITIVIMGMVMLIASVTLTTLIKISTVSSNKTRTRNETEFVLELVRRTVRNSNPSDVFVYSTVDARTYNSETGLVENRPEIVDISNEYANGLGVGVIGSEIHFRPYGYTNWICIGFFEDKNNEDMGYILKTSTKDLSNQHENCFDSTLPDYLKYTIMLNSEYVDINSFEISYTETIGSNYLFRFSISAEPVDWYLAPGAPIKREIVRQAVVSTEGLMW
ncbi:MAG: prepilin-type N-terminal cleavage/methylation domain-containing protein [Candidatus Dojkabacteria bacterium]|nr:prepilin-type N-terminal cleavage/methylation domain-containing protein [Candidatus Dojkabacteria bacterium]